MDKQVSLALTTLELDTVAEIASVDQLRRLTSAHLSALYWCETKKSVSAGRQSQKSGGGGCPSQAGGVGEGTCHFPRCYTLFQLLHPLNRVPGS